MSCECQFVGTPFVQYVQCLFRVTQQMIADFNKFKLNNKSMSVQIYIKIQTTDNLDKLNINRTGLHRSVCISGSLLGKPKFRGRSSDISVLWPQCRR